MKKATIEPEIVTESKIMQFVDTLTKGAMNGLPVSNKFLKMFTKGFASSSDLAAEYLSNGKYKDNDTRVDALIKWEAAKCFGVGFLTGLGGFITLPIALPADMVATWVVQARMVGAIAEIYGHSVQESQVQTSILLCLIGSDMASVLRSCGVKVVNKVTENLIKKIPGKVLTEINKRVGFRLLTKFGEKGVINLAKAIPVLGGGFSGAFDTLSARQVGKFAKGVFRPVP